LHETPAVNEQVSKQVLLLTDGINAYTIDALDVVSSMAHESNMRTFVIDTGTGLSHHVAQAVARAGCGVVEYADDGEQLLAKVMRQLNRVAQVSGNSIRLLLVV
jgi:hypothetical protein